VLHQSYTVANRYADSGDRFFTNGNSSAYKDPAAFTNSITYADAITLRSQLQAAIKINSMNGLNSHPLHRMSGWSQGVYIYWGCYRWLDKDHLLLATRVSGGILPLVINWRNNTFWQPMTDSPNSDCLANWSEGLQRIISLNNKTISSTMSMVKQSKVSKAISSGFITERFTVDVRFCLALTCKRGVQWISAKR